MTAQCLSQNNWRGTCRLMCYACEIKRSNDHHGRLQRLIYPWSSGHWQLKGVLDAQKGGQFELCHITRGDYYERHHQKTQQQQLEISMRAKWNQEIPTGGPCMYGFRASILLPHHSSSSPDTYLNHRGRTTDPKRKMSGLYFG